LFTHCSTRCHQIEFEERFKVVGNQPVLGSWDVGRHTAVITHACCCICLISHNYQIEYGERFKVVGNQPALGSWDVTKAPELKWYDGDLWAGSVELPVGKDIEFKV
jgi:hypothetical protein